MLEGKTGFCDGPLSSEPELGFDSFTARNFNQTFIRISFQRVNNAKYEL
jgi:hypothetical protein